VQIRRDFANNHGENCASRGIFWYKTVQWCICVLLSSLFETAVTKSCRFSILSIHLRIVIELTLALLECCLYRVQQSYFILSHVAVSWNSITESSQLDLRHQPYIQIHYSIVYCLGSIPMWSLWKLEALISCITPCHTLQNFIHKRMGNCMLLREYHTNWSWKKTQKLAGLTMYWVKIEFKCGSLCMHSM
jgi:hypothetical protein